MLLPEKFAKKIMLTVFPPKNLPGVFFSRKIPVTPLSGCRIQEKLRLLTIAYSKNWTANFCLLRNFICRKNSQTVCDDRKIRFDIPNKVKFYDKALNAKKWIKLVLGLKT